MKRGEERQGESGRIMRLNLLARVGVPLTPTQYQTICHCEVGESQFDPPYHEKAHKGQKDTKRPSHTLYT